MGHHNSLVMLEKPLETMVTLVPAPLTNCHHPGASSEMVFPSHGFGGWIWGGTSDHVHGRKYRIQTSKGQK